MAPSAISRMDTLPALVDGTGCGVAVGGAVGGTVGVGVLSAGQVVFGPAGHGKPT